jgi:hypothetical protein
MTGEYWSNQFELAVDRLRTLLSYVDDETVDIEERYSRAKWAAKDLQVHAEKAASLARNLMFLLENPSYQKEKP